MSKHVLIVEDDQEIVDLARRAVSKIDQCAFTGTLCGYDGLLAVATATDPVDVIVLDLTLPDIDGLEFLRRLAEEKYTGTIVLASGHDKSVLKSAKRLAEIHGLSVHAVLQKPYLPSELRKIIEDCTPAEHPQPEADDGPVTGDLSGATLVPYYQPQFDIESGSVAGFEALIRLQLADGPLVGPSALFSHLRNHEERVTTALSIADLVMRDLAFALGKTAEFPGVSLNFDARVLEDDDAMAEFTSLVERHEIPKHMVTIEVIEKSLPHSDQRLLEVLTRLRMAGFELSLDDYGTGGSNHDLLRRCPFNELKLDHTIIQSGLNDAVTDKFITSAVETARSLDLRLVAEGIETMHDLAFVRNHGIRIVQGFLFERPMPIERALPFVLSGHEEALSA